VELVGRPWRADDRDRADHLRSDEPPPKE